MASAEVALRFKVGPLNETKNFCLNEIFVGLHLLAGHRFEVRRFVKECVRANLCAPPNLFPREAYPCVCMVWSIYGKRALRALEPGRIQCAIHARRMHGRMHGRMYVCIHMCTTFRALMSAQSTNVASRICMHAERNIRTGVDVVGRSESVHKLACAVRTDRGKSCSSCSRC